MIMDKVIFDLTLKMIIIIYLFTLRYGFYFFFRSSVLASENQLSLSVINKPKSLAF